MLGNVTVQQTSGGCNVTACNYDGIVNGSIVTTYVYPLSAYLLHFLIYIF